MNKPIKNDLAQAVSSTFENMAFCDMEETNIYAASIPVKSPYQGTIKIFAPFFLLKEISQSIYSIEIIDINEKLMLDVLAELANTVAGQFMESRLEDNQIFELGVPETGISDRIDIEASQEIYFFKTGDSIIGASVNIKEKEN